MRSSSASRLPAEPRCTEASNFDMLVNYTFSRPATGIWARMVPLETDPSLRTVSHSLNIQTGRHTRSRSEMLEYVPHAHMGSSNWDRPLGSLMPLNQMMIAATPMKMGSLLFLITQAVQMPERERHDLFQRQITTARSPVDFISMSHNATGWPNFLLGSGCGVWAESSLIGLQACARPRTALKPIDRSIWMMLLKHMLSHALLHDRAHATVPVLDICFLQIVRYLRPYSRYPYDQMNENRNMREWTPEVRMSEVLLVPDPRGWCQPVTEVLVVGISHYERVAVRFEGGFSSAERLSEDFFKGCSLDTPAAAGIGAMKSRADL